MLLVFVLLFGAGLSHLITVDSDKRCEAYRYGLRSQCHVLELEERPTLNSWTVLVGGAAAFAGLDDAHVTPEQSLEYQCRQLVKRSGYRFAYPFLGELYDTCVITERLLSFHITFLGMHCLSEGEADAASTF